MPINKKELLTYIVHLLFLLMTFFTTTIAGVQWLNKDPFELSNFYLGLPYSISILLMLGAHEMGHYFAARYHGISATLPYFIPAPPFLINPFGTMGAIIRIRSGWNSKKNLFDIGISGPIAGLIVSIIILLIGFITLPPKEYLFSIHPEYKLLASIPTNGLTFGSSLLFSGLVKLFGSSHFVPPMNEIYHYPFLCVGWFGLFVTALNLMPVGQLDGGHIIYAMTGQRRHRIIARIFFAFLIISGILSLIPLIKGELYLASTGWLVWAAILYFLVKLDHPQVIDTEPLSPNRKLLGWIMIFVFILTFPPIPFIDFPLPH